MLRSSWLILFYFLFFSGFAYFAVKSNIRLHVHIVTLPESYIDIPVETGDCQGLIESVFQMICSTVTPSEMKQGTVLYEWVTE